MNEVWIKGTWDGTKAIFPTAQHLNDADVYFMAATFVGTDITLNGQNQTSYRYTAIDNLIFTLNETNESLITDDNVAIVLSANQDVTPGSVRNYYIQPTLIKMNDTTAIPANPIIKSCDEYSERWGYGMIDFLIPVIDVNGNSLNINKLYYNLYFDSPNEPFVFSTDDYMSLEEDMTNIPYEYDDYEDFFAMLDGTHSVAFYVADYTRIGVQSVYLGGNTETRSNIVWYVSGTNGISPITGNSEGRENYYDLTGKQINAPTKGVYIKQITSKNGAKNTIKIIK